MTNMTLRHSDAIQKCVMTYMALRDLRKEEMTLGMQKAILGSTKYRPVRVYES